LSDGKAEEEGQGVMVHQGEELQLGVVISRAATV
jgi:hypothetical protein